MRLFLAFALISGIGWLLDMVSYVTLSQIFSMAPAYANFISSMVGVTYVWTIATSRLFDRRGYGRSIYLPIYWAYQGVSIAAYSVLISIVAASAINFNASEILNISSGLVAKAIITAPNLLTNFIFMKSLTNYMKFFPK